MAIHPTAVIDPKAHIDPTAEIGPYAIIEGQVDVGPECRIYPHAYVSGWVELAEGVQVHPSAVVGHHPQDFGYRGERSYCRIGSGTIIRENASVHSGTGLDSETVIGKNCMIMASGHVAHNCVLGNNVQVHPFVALGGHCEVGDNVIFGGVGGLHQFTRLGRFALLAGWARAVRDVPPFFMCVHDTVCTGVNVIGMKRAGFAPEQIDDARLAYKTLCRTTEPFSKAVETLAGVVTTDVGREILEFVSVRSKRGYAGGPRNRSHN